MIFPRNIVVISMISSLVFFEIVFGQENWTVKSPIPNLNDVIWAGTQFVAVGNEGAIFTSPDGADWTKINSGTAKNLRAAVWNGNKIVVVGDTVITTSTDGKVWAATTVLVAANKSSLAWTGTIFIAVSTGYGVFTSSDGFTWDRRSSIGFADVAVGNNIIVAVGQLNLASSPDGISWTKRDSSFYFDGKSVIWTGTQFVAVGDNHIYTSSNGITWSNPRFLSEDSNLDLSSLVWTGNMIVAGGSTTKSDGIFTSPDAIKWTMRKAPIQSGSTIMAIASSPSGQIVAIAGGTILTSSDAISWIPRISSTSGSFTSICRTYDKWVATIGGLASPYEGLNIFSSVDASAWSITAGPMYSFPGYSRLVWCDTQLILTSGYMSSSGGNIFTSPDGVNWKQCITNVSGLSDVAYGANKNVAVGYHGSILTSTDGINWIFRNSGTHSSLTAITWTGTQFVAVGDYGVIITSPDGIAWTRKYANQANVLTSLFWTGSQIVAVGRFGSIITSPDGNTWTLQNSGVTANLYGITGTSNRMAAIGAELNHNSADSVGIILSSRDGITWSKRISGNIYPLKDIAYADSQFIAVGDNGAVIVSPLSAGISSPLSKFTFRNFIPQNNGQGITVDLSAGQYTLSILDIAGRMLYTASGIAGAATRRTFNPSIKTNCCIINLNQNGEVLTKKLIMVN
jgi:hypothetical protein